MTKEKLSIFKQQSEQIPEEQKSVFLRIMIINRTMGWFEKFAAIRNLEKGYVIIPPDQVIADLCVALKESYAIENNEKYTFLAEKHGNYLSSLKSYIFVNSVQEEKEFMVFRTFKPG